MSDNTSQKADGDTVDDNESDESSSSSDSEERIVEKEDYVFTSMNPQIVEPQEAASCTNRPNLLHAIWEHRNLRKQELGEQPCTR